MAQLMCQDSRNGKRIVQELLVYCDDVAGFGQGNVLLIDCERILGSGLGIALQGNRSLAVARLRNGSDVVTCMSTLPKRR